MKRLNEKLVIVINGKGGVGKDTFCQMAGETFAAASVSSITPVKEIAAACGWDGAKDNKARRFLADLKQLLVAYNGYPNRWLEGEYRRFLDGGADILFVHIREADQIRDFLRRVPTRAVTLLVRSGRLGAAPYGNDADDRAEDFPYDYIFDNDYTLEDLRAEVERFLTALLEQEKIKIFPSGPENSRTPRE